MSGVEDLDVAREHPELADWDGAYVLGALSPTERRRYERHLEACARCRTAVAELSGLPGLLAGVPLDRVGSDPATADDLPPDLLPRLAAAADRSRRRSRVRYGVVGGLVAAAAVVVAVALVQPGSTRGQVADAPASPTATATATATAVTDAGVQFALQPVVPNPLAVDVALVQEPWGTRMNLQCRFAAPDGDPTPHQTYSYTLFATNRAGSTMQVGGWSYGPDTVAEPVGTSNWPVTQIAAVEVRSGDGTLVLLRGTR